MKQEDEPDSSTSATARENLPPRAPFEPPVRDPKVLAILKGLNPSVTPPPIQIATTDGEFAASFAAAPREAPHGDVTPAPEASVVVRESTPAPAAPKAPRAVKPSGEKLNTTFRLRAGRASAAWPVLGAVVVIAVAAFVWQSRGVPDVATQAPLATPAPAPNPAPRPAPVQPATLHPDPVVAPPPPAQSAAAPAASPSTERATSAGRPQPTRPTPSSERPSPSDIVPGTSPF